MKQYFQMMQNSNKKDAKIEAKLSKDAKLKKILKNHFIFIKYFKNN